jgi:hypothetical protein
MQKHSDGSDPELIMPCIKLVFDMAGQKYHMKDGTFRNFISKLRKSGENLV